MTSLFILVSLLVPLSACWSDEARVLREGRFSLEVKALPLDAVEAFFLARGFDASAAQWIARKGCVHKFAAAHDGGAEEQAVTVDLNDWRVRSASGPWQPLASKESWEHAWEQRRVPQPARTAFRWALFPTRQTLHPGDRIWGMVVMDFVPGTVFDLQGVWQVGEKRSETIVTHWQCASS